MICPICKQPKKKDDFYYEKSNPTRKTQSGCRTCFAKKQKIKNDKARMSKTDPLHAYFS